MALDVKFLLGADDKEFHTALNSLESATAQKAGRIGQVLKGQVKGFHELGQGINKVADTFQNVLTGFGLVSVLQAGWSFIQSYRDAAKQAAEAVEKERASRQSINQLLADVRSNGINGPSGPGAAMEARRDQLMKQIRDTGELAEKTKRYNDLLAEIGVQYRAMGNVPLADQKKLTEMLKLEERLKEIHKALDGINGAFDEGSAKLEEFIRGQERISELRMRASLADAAGNPEMSATLEEEARHLQRLAEIGKLEAEGRVDAANRQRDIEEDLHNARLNNIDAEEARRRAASAEQERQAKRAKEREAEQAREQEFRNGVDEESLEVERLKLEGKEKESKVLAEQLEHKKRLHDIEKRDGLTDADRQRWIDEENRNFDLRIKAAQAENTREAERRSLTAGVGFGAAESVRQVLGSRIGDQARSAQDRAATAAEGSRKILQMIHNLLQRPNWAQGGPARFG